MNEWEDVQSNVASRGWGENFIDMTGCGQAEESPNHLHFVVDVISELMSRCQRGPGALTDCSVNESRPKLPAYRPVASPVISPVL